MFLCGAIVCNRPQAVLKHFLIDGVRVLYSTLGTCGCSRHTAAGGTASRERQVIGWDRTFPARLATSGTGHDLPVAGCLVTGSNMLHKRHSRVESGRCPIGSREDNRERQKNEQTFPGTDTGVSESFIQKSRVTVEDDPQADLMADHWTGPISKRTSLQ